MSLPTTTVVAEFIDHVGRPRAGVTLSVLLSGWALDGEAFVSGDRHQARTDETGRASFSVWPNDRGDRPTFYKVLIRDERGRLLMRGSATVPSSADPVNLITILDVHP